MNSLLFVDGFLTLLTCYYIPTDALQLNVWSINTVRDSTLKSAISQFFSGENLNTASLIQLSPLFYTGKVVKTITVKTKHQRSWVLHSLLQRELLLALYQSLHFFALDQGGRLKIPFVKPNKIIQEMKLIFIVNLPELSSPSFPLGVYNFVYSNMCCASAVPRVGVAHTPNSRDWLTLFDIPSPNTPPVRA